MNSEGFCACQCAFFTLPKAWRAILMVGEQATRARMHAAHCQILCSAAHVMPACTHTYRSCRNRRDVAICRERGMGKEADMAMRHGAVHLHSGRPSTETALLLVILFL